VCSAGCENPGMLGNSLLFDLDARGAIALTGRDRASFLHGLVTNDIRRLTPGTGCAAAFLTPKGKMLADCVVLCEEDRLELDCEGELASKIEDLLRKYLVFNDVTIVNATAANAVFHVAGKAGGKDRREEEDLLRTIIRLGDDFALPREPHAHCGHPVRVVRENRTGVPGYDVRCPSSLSEEIRRAFLSAGARIASFDRLDELRIAAGIPRWGFELTEAVLPDEAGLRERGFISENKGCYIGQETVARIKTYGHVNRRLVLLSVSGGVPARENEIFFEGEKSGAVTSVTPLSGSGGSVALGYVRRERCEPGTALSVRTPEGDLAATVEASPASYSFAGRPSR
jgi:folate-binding protein YgfZ